MSIDVFGQKKYARADALLRFDLNRLSAAFAELGVLVEDSSALGADLCETCAVLSFLCGCCGNFSRCRSRFSCRSSSITLEQVVCERAA